MAVGIGTAVLTLPVAGTAVAYAAGAVGGTSSTSDSAPRIGSPMLQGGPTSVPGDNGDIKVHNPGTPTADERDEPHVCKFYLDAFHFDSLQSVDWNIDEWPPTGTTKNVLTGSVVLTDGSGRTPAAPKTLSLPDGHYKVHWVIGGHNGMDKYKEFWVKCEAPPTTPSTSKSTTPPTTPPTTPSTSKSIEPTTITSSSSTTSQAASPTGTTPAPSPSSTAPGLAHTGAGGVVELSAIAALLVAAGVFLRNQVVRTQRRQH